MTTKERPILFSAPMVRAILADSKTQTRRRMVRQKKHDFTDYNLFGQRGHPDDEAERRGGWATPWVAIETAADWPDSAEDQCVCPYARERGDRLWVRETFHAFGRWETRYSAAKSRDEWHFVDMTKESGKTYRYATDGDGLWPMPGRRQMAGEIPGWWKRPAIFMPRAASRILLKITDLRVERLLDISTADALAEGVNVHPDFHDKPPGSIYSPVQAYRDLWEGINGAGSWEANPWVWAVSFRRVP